MKRSSDTKRCPRCGKEKPLSEFYKNRLYKDGHVGWCRSCFRENNKKINKKIIDVEEIKKMLDERYNYEVKKNKRLCIESLNIEPANLYGFVEMSIGESSNYVFLNQRQIKDIIHFLSMQIKE